MTTASRNGRDPLTDRGRRTRQRLVTAARVVFEEKGFSATRMGDITAQAGVSHGTVYTYFDTKEDLLAASVQQLVADIRASIRTAESDDPIERVWNANHRYLTAYLSHARLMSVVEEAGATDPQFAEIVADLRRTHASRVASQIRKLQSADLVSVDIDPENASQALCAMVEGFARNWTEQVNSDLVGSTRTLTQLWVHSLGLNEGSSGLIAGTLGLDAGSLGLIAGSLGLDAGSLGLDEGSVGLDAELIAAHEGLSGTGSAPREKADQQSTTGQSTSERKSGTAQLRRPRKAGTPHSKSTQYGGTPESTMTKPSTTQSNTAQQSTTTHLEANDAVHTRA